MIRINYGEPRSMLTYVLAITSTQHWIAADGRRIHVAKMDDGHLVNTVRKLRRDAISMLQEEDWEKLPQGIAREDYLLARVKPYAKMLAELNKRGLVEEAAREPNEPPRRKRSLASLMEALEDDDFLGDAWGDS